MRHTGCILLVECHILFTLFPLVELIEYHLHHGICGTDEVPYIVSEYHAQSSSPMMTKVTY